jgi:YidC/Oxa1 family membrane protein insertase
VLELWHSLIDGLGTVLRFLHDGLEPLFGAMAWGWAIVALTVVVRIILLPLAVKQINSMRAMQKIQPELKKIQAKHKVDRGLMRTDPEKFRAQRAKQQEAMMGLYKEHQVNPAASCLPLLAQMPVFFALFWLLRDEERIPELARFGWYGIDNLAALAGGVPPGGYILIALMGATTYYSQKQMMANNPSSAQMPQTKILLYVMPIMLLVFAFNFPTGVVLYWVTTNVWTMGQQWFMFRKVEHDQPGRPADGKGKPKPKDKKKREDEQ